MQQHIKLLSSPIISFYILLQTFYVTSFQKVTQWHVMGEGVILWIFLLNAGILRGFDFTTVFQDG